MLSPDYVEAILLWSKNQNQSDKTLQWFLDHNLSAQPMSSGLLISGTLASFDLAFQLELTTEEPPIELPVPIELEHEVESITIPSPRRYNY